MDYKKELQMQCPQLTDTVLDLLYNYIELRMSKKNEVSEICKNSYLGMSDNVDIFTPTETDDKDIISQQKPEDENIF